MNHQSVGYKLTALLRSKVIRYPILLILLALGLFFLFREAHHLSGNDFIEYWSATRINLEGGNPYSPDELLKVQKQGGWIHQQPKLMVYPPWTFSIVIIFGLFEYSHAQLLWLLCQIGVILYCANKIWALYGGQVKQQWVAWVIPFIFAPTILVLGIGQITPLLLLGIIGFISFIEKHRNDYIAGVFLTLVLIKPQVIYIFWIALLFWIVEQRRWLILVSSGVSLLFLILLALIFNPNVIKQFLEMMQANLISQWASPTIGAYLRFFWLGTDIFWPQYLPAIFGGLWFLVYWFKHHSSWHWLKELPILLFVSILTTPYAWTYDQVILVPAVIQATIWLLNARKRWVALLLACLFLGINILDLGLHMRLSDFWFVWMVPVLLIWYLLADRFKSPMKIMLPA